MIRALILDLDGTLYDERDYVLSGFRVVAEEIARLADADAAALFDVMVTELHEHGRGKVFDKALTQAGLDVGRDRVAALVTLYREHRPDIALWPGVADTLAALRGDYRFALVTDGLSLMQRRKVEALGVEALVDAVLYCWEHESPKPDPACYAEALRRLEAKPEEAVVIGDNPGHDMAAAKAVGCRSIRVLTGRFAGAGEGGFPADATVANFAEAVALLRSGFGGTP